MQLGSAADHRAAVLIVLPHQTLDTTAGFSATRYRFASWRLRALMPPLWRQRRVLNLLTTAGAAAAAYSSPQTTHHGPSLPAPHAALADYLADDFLSRLWTALA